MDVRFKFNGPSREAAHRMLSEILRDALRRAWRATRAAARAVLRG